MWQKILDKFNSFIQRGNNDNIHDIEKSCLNLEILPQGMFYNFNVELSNNLSELFLANINGNNADKIKFNCLCHLFEEEKTSIENLDNNQGFIFLWNTIYELINQLTNNDEDYSYYFEILDILEIPQLSNIKPVINCNNTLSDENFDLFIEHWKQENDDKKYRNVKIIGAVIEINGHKNLIHNSYFNISSKINELKNHSSKNQTTNEQYWGIIRNLAIQNKVDIASDYLKNSIILTPETLKFEFVKNKENNIIEAIPNFDNAPENWINKFDSYNNVQNNYDILQDNTRTRITLTTQVKNILTTFKNIAPQRKILGDKAKAFILNPYAFLGEESYKIIDEKQFEQAKQLAQIYSSTFVLKPNINFGNIQSVTIQIETILDNQSSNTSNVKLKTYIEFDSFLSSLNQAIQKNQLLLGYLEYDLTIDNQAQNILDEGLFLLHTWKNQPKKLDDIISFEDIYLFDNYAQRIADIGIDKPICIPFVAKNQEQNSEWLPQELRPCLAVNIPPKSEKVILPLEKNWLEQIKTKILQAQKENKIYIEDDKIPNPIPIHEAQNIVNQIQHYFEPVNEKHHQENIRKNKINKESLIIKHNFEQIDYVEERKNLLAISNNKKAKLPKALKENIKLYPHQNYGVAWLQNLMENAPENCRGAIMADDMGLGKTLQILTFIAKFYEDNPNSLPSLILAPVTLLQNWQDEIKKYFYNTFPEILCLYDKELINKKQNKNLIDEKLQEKGITNLLKNDWIGNTKIILTTYETMANYEFSFARQSFSIMVCDEAQKIKTPNAKITRVAKAQKVKFKIACTGTPVENSLVDLWCLFDFIQPSLLYQLNEFTQKYRKPIEASTDEEKKVVNELRDIIEPQILRRTKTDKDINLDLKDKTFSKDEIYISNYQRALYHQQINYLQNNKEENIKERSKISFGVFHAIKAICAEPYCMPKKTFKIDENGIKQHKINSPKMNWLVQQLHIIKLKQEKVIIFTDLRIMQIAIKEFINLEFGLKSVFVIHGDTKNRQDDIDKFSKVDGFNIIILSPLAAGCGLNIVAANHVIHFTRTWNPAKEAQANDRAYRIGQEKEVYIYTPTVISDEFITFEAKLAQLMANKMELSDEVLKNDGALNHMLNGIDNDISHNDLMPTHTIKNEKLEERIITIDDIDKLDGFLFEKFCTIIYQKQSFQAINTKKSNDGGTDILVIKRDKTGFLIQCKHSANNEKKLSWEAVQNIMGGKAIYEKSYPNIKFTPVIFTNQYFNKNAHEKAKINDIKVIERNYIEFFLKDNIIFEKEIFFE